MAGNLQVGWNKAGHTDRHMGKPHKIRKDLWQVHMKLLRLF